MDTQQMRDEKHRLVLESQHIFNKWNAMATARWFYYEKREDAIFDRLSADMETIWAEYQAVTDQWMKLDLEIIAIERGEVVAAAPEVQSAPECVHVLNIPYTFDGVNYRACANCAYQEIVPGQAPKFPAGTFTKIRPVTLSTKGHEFNRLDRERQALEMLEQDAAVSLRREIVESEIVKDGE